MTSEAQARALFAQLAAVVTALENYSKVINDVKTVVNRVASNSELFVQGYHEHGAEIAALQLKVDKLMSVCPKMRPITDEFKKVDDK